MAHPTSSIRIVDLTPSDGDLIDALVPLSVRAAAMLAPRWLPTDELARREILDVAGSSGICRVLMAEGVPCGWAGAMQSGECVWELHPLLIDPMQQRAGFGRRLVEDVEQHARSAGALTMELSTSDAIGATTLSDTDLFADPLGALSAIDVRDAERGHAFRFWQRVGYVVVGVIPDAEGVGAPKLHLAKSLRR